MNLLKLTNEERIHILDNLLNNHDEHWLLFSDRLALEEEFFLFLQGYPKAADGPMNFLSWLAYSKYAKRVGQLLIEDAGKRAR